MAINTRLHSDTDKRYQKLDHDINTGRVQAMIDNGWTTMQIARKYDVSEYTIKRHARDGRLSFNENRNRGTKADQIALSEMMTPAKRLAMSGKW